MAKIKNTTQSTAKDTAGIANETTEEITYVGAMKNVGMSANKDSRKGGGPVTIVVHKKRVQ
jgi:hypothetical protein